MYGMLGRGDEPRSKRRCLSPETSNHLMLEKYQLHTLVNMATSADYRIPSASSFTTLVQSSDLMSVSCAEDVTGQNWNTLQQECHSGSSAIALK